jgi:hypothetical protein
VKTFRVVLIVMLACAATVGVLAQRPPETPAVPQVPDEARNLYATLQVKRSGLADAMALLQKELDSVNAEQVRLLQRLAAAHPDFDLVQSGTLVVAYTPKKKDESKTKH